VPFPSVSLYYMQKGGDRPILKYVGSLVSDFTILSSGAVNSIFFLKGVWAAEVLRLLYGALWLFLAEANGVRNGFPSWNCKPGIVSVSFGLWSRWLRRGFIAGRIREGWLFYFLDVDLCFKFKFFKSFFQ